MRREVRKRPAVEPQQAFSGFLTENLKDDPYAGEKVGTRPLPKLMIGATAAMVALGVALTVFAGPLYDVATRAGDDLQGTERYITSILGPEGVR